MARNWRWHSQGHWARNDGPEQDRKGPRWAVPGFMKSASSCLVRSGQPRGEILREKRKCGEERTLPASSPPPQTPGIRPLIAVTSPFRECVFPLPLPFNEQSLISRQPPPNSKSAPLPCTTGHDKYRHPAISAPPLTCYRAAIQC